MDQNFKKLLDQNKEVLQALHKASRRIGNDLDLEGISRQIRPDSFLELINLVRKNIDDIYIAVYETKSDWCAPEDDYSNQGSVRYSFRVFSAEPKISMNGHPDWSLNYDIAIMQCDGAGDILEKKLQENFSLVRIVKTPKADPEEVHIYRHK